jgi:hypothetical protein
MLCFLLLLWGFPANAQQANLNYLGTQSTTTIATANTFVNPSGLVQSTGRQSCLIQYRPVTGVLTATTLGFVAFGSTAPTATANAFVLTAFATLTCENQSSEVEGGAVWVAAQVTGDAFIIKVK